MGQLQVVVGGQAGSEAKGACTAFLVRDARKTGRNVTVVRVAGPNAGHTAYDDLGRKWALRQVPVGAVADHEAALVIGAGSEIELEVLASEVTALEAAGIPIRGRLLVDGQATILTREHHEREAKDGLVGKLGSTGKGVGAARASRIMREATIASEMTAEITEIGGFVMNTPGELYAVTQDPNGTVIIEGTQGYVLGLHAGYYPQCTSSDCRAVDFLAMAGIDPMWVAREDYRAWVVMRTYPIRVAGNSGPLLGEQTWAELDLPEERTTVTQKVRRVGAWNPEWAAAAVTANGGPGVVSIALSMVDYIVPEVFGMTDVVSLNEEAVDILMETARFVSESAGAQVDLMGTGPQTFLDLRALRAAELADA